MTPAAFMRLFPEFRAESWNAWREILGRITEAVREFVVAAGRGSGKSRICALLACCYAAREYPRAPGERIYVGIFAPDRRQARVTFSYVVGLLRSDQNLERLIEREQRESVELGNGVTVEVITASTAAPRGRSYALAIVEEAAFLPQDTSANPDVELLRALRPALARVRGSLLAVVSSPYARRGILWDAAKRAESGSDGRLLYIQAPTMELNPSFDETAVETALEDDPAGASAEYLAEFRRDIETFLSRDAVEAVTIPGQLELPPRADVSYSAFVDFAGGSGKDSATLAISHAEERDGQKIAILDAVREVKPPFSPESVCVDFAVVLDRFRLKKATADRYAADFATEAMKRQGVTLEASDKTKSDIYREVLPMVTSGQVELLDLQRLQTQLVSLERRVSRGGRDSIDHPPGGHDDVANAVAGALVSVAPSSDGGEWAVWNFAGTHCIQSSRGPEHAEELTLRANGVDPEAIRAEEEERLRLRLLNPLDPLTIKRKKMLQMQQSTNQAEVEK